MFNTWEHNKTILPGGEIRMSCLKVGVGHKKDTFMTFI